MQFIKILDVDEKLVEFLWSRVSCVGGFYSIGDANSHDHFRRMLFESSFVLQAGEAFLRLEVINGGIELHPIIFGVSAVRNPSEVLASVHRSIGNMFKFLPIYCIIPSRMRGARKLALRAGMTEFGDLVRNLSGIPIVCTGYIWRPKNV